MSEDIERTKKIILIRGIYFIGIGFLSLLFLAFLIQDIIQYVSMIFFIIIHFVIGVIDLNVVYQFNNSKKKPSDFASSIVLSYTSGSCIFCMGILFVGFFVFIANFGLLIFIIFHLIISVVLIAKSTREIYVLDEIADPTRVKAIVCNNCGYRFQSAKARCPSCKTYWVNDPEHIDTNNKDIIFQIGLNFYNNKEYDKALVTFKKITKIDKKHGAAWYNRACCSSILVNPIKALEALKKAIDIDKEWKNKAKDDKDFDNLRDTIEFNEIV